MRLRYRETICSVTRGGLERSGVIREGFEANQRKVEVSAQAPHRLKAVPNPKASAQLNTPDKANHIRIRAVQIWLLRRYRYQLDRTKPVPSVHTEHGNQQDTCHRHTDQRDKCAEQHREAAQEFGQDGQPRHQVRGRHSQSAKDGGERHGSFEDLGITVFREAESDMRRNRIGAQVGAFIRLNIQRYS